MEIRNLRDVPEDIPQLAQWFHETWGYLSPDRTQADIVKGLHKSIKGNQIPFTYVGYVDGVLAGSASGMNSDMLTHPQLKPWLGRVFVSPEFRAQGVGAALVRATMLRMKALHIQKAYLFTPDQEAWYAKMGWKLIEHYRYRRHLVAVMSIRLSSVK